MVITGKGAPSLVRRQLGARLRRLRVEAGKSQDDVVAAHIAGRTKLWKIESGRATIKEGDVLALARFYELDTRVTNDLVKLVEASRTSGYVEEYGPGVPESLGFYADLEASAAALAIYNSELVSGLLQTADYIRAGMEATGSLSAEFVEQRVAFRRQRQRAFFERSRPARLDVVLTAGAVSIQVGSPSVMEEQMAHLRAVDERDGVSVRVLPFENGVHMAMRGPFTMLDFDDPDDPALVFIESLAGSRYLERADHVAQYRAAFAEIGAQAIPVREYLDGRHQLDQGISE